MVLRNFLKKSRRELVKDEEIRNAEMVGIRAWRCIHVILTLET